jgi:hypothetical protein
MHFHLPKPLHGWREFAGEVGIIVVGVLVALSAQQFVEDIHDRAAEHAFRETIDHEIGLNIFAYDVRSGQFACEEKRVRELKAWLDRARAGAQVPALRPSGPVFFSPYRSAWDNRDAEVFNDLPAARRQKYAEFYDELSNNWSVMQVEQAHWDHLIPYSEPGPINLTDRRTIRQVVAQIEDANVNLEANLPISIKIAQVLKIKEIQPDNLPPDWRKHLTDCHSAIAAPVQIERKADPGSSPG